MSHHVRGSVEPIPSKPPCIDRREFVERSIGAVIAASVLGGCASLVTRTITPVDGALRLALVHFPELTADDVLIITLRPGA